MGLRTTDTELLTMNKVERLLRKLPENARNNVAHWVSTRDWSDKPIPYALTEKAIGEGAK